MKTITSILAILALGTTLAVAADEAKPGAAAEKPAVDKPATAKPDAPKSDAPKPDAAKPDKPKRDPAEVFKKLDSNNDGKLSAEEWKSSQQSKKDATKGEEYFGKKDQDGDKSLSLEEFSAHGKKKDK
jgi:hypothetical protein